MVSMHECTSIQQVDPLDAFMAEIDQQVQANIPNTTRAADGIECDEEADPVADYMEVGFGVSDA